MDYGVGGKIALVCLQLLLCFAAKPLAESNMSMRFSEPIGALILADRRTNSAGMHCHVRQTAFTQGSMNRTVAPARSISFGLFFATTSLSTRGILGTAKLAHCERHRPSVILDFAPAFQPMMATISPRCTSEGCCTVRTSISYILPSCTNDDLLEVI